MTFLSQMGILSTDCIMREKYYKCFWNIVKWRIFEKWAKYVWYSGCYCHIGINAKSWMYQKKEEDAAAQMQPHHHLHKEVLTKKGFFKTRVIRTKSFESWHISIILLHMVLRKSALKFSSLSQFRDSASFTVLQGTLQGRLCNQLQSMCTVKIWLYK